MKTTLSKQKKEKKYFLFLFLFFLVFTLFIFSCSLGASSWLPGWSKRIKLTTNSTKIDEDLTWFPITVFLKAGNGETTKVFDEVGANKYKIAIADDSDPPVQYYIEIEQWDEVNKVGVLHFGKAGEVLPSASDKVFYLYYDNIHENNTDYVGEEGSAPGQKVWETAGVMVQHMNDNPNTSSIKDSTLNANNGTKKAVNEPTEADGKIGKGQNFDGNDDYIVISDLPALNNKTEVTFSYWVKYVGAPGYWDLSGYLKSSAAAIRFGRDPGRSIFINPGTHTDISVSYTLAEESWYYLVLTIKVGDKWQVFANGDFVQNGTNGLPTNAIETGCPFGIGASYEGYFVHHVNGTIDEVRIYNRTLSAAEIKASYHSTNDTLLTYGTEEIMLLGVKEIFPFNSKFPYVKLKEIFPFNSKFPYVKLNQTIDFR